MVEHEGRRRQVAEGHRFVEFQLMKLDLAVQLIPRQREVGAVEIDLDELRRVLVNVIDIQFMSRDMNGNEERHPHDVVPMDVRHEDMEFLDALLHRRGAGLAEARPHVDVERLATVADFGAGRVAAIQERLMDLACLDGFKDLLGFLQADLSPLGDDVL